jgi:hypothetical protein
MTGPGLTPDEHRMATLLRRLIPEIDDGWAEIIARDMVTVAALLDVGNRAATVQAMTRLPRPAILTAIESPKAPRTTAKVAPSSATFDRAAYAAAVDATYEFAHEAGWDSRGDLVANADWIPNKYETIHGGHGDWIVVRVTRGVDGAVGYYVHYGDDPCVHFEAYGDDAIDRIGAEFLNHIRASLRAWRALWAERDPAAAAFTARVGGAVDDIPPLPTGPSPNGVDS